MLLGFVQRRDGRRNNTATGVCSTTGSSHCARRNLEPCFSDSFVYVRLARHRDPRCHLRPYCSFENSQIRRSARRERSRHRWANLGLHRARARSNGNPVTCQHDPIQIASVCIGFPLSERKSLLTMAKSRSRSPVRGPNCQSSTNGQCCKWATRANKCI